MSANEARDVLNFALKPRLRTRGVIPASGELGCGPVFSGARLAGMLLAAARPALAGPVSRSTGDEVLPRFGQGACVEFVLMRQGKVADVCLRVGGIFEVFRERKSELARRQPCLRQVPELCGRQASQGDGGLPVCFRVSVDDFETVPEGARLRVDEVDGQHATTAARQGHVDPSLLAGFELPGCSAELPFEVREDDRVVFEQKLPSLLDFLAEGFRRGARTVNFGASAQKSPSFDIYGCGAIHMFSLHGAG